MDHRCGFLAHSGENLLRRYFSLASNSNQLSSASLDSLMNVDMGIQPAYHELVLEPIRMRKAPDALDIIFCHTGRSGQQHAAGGSG